MASGFSTIKLEYKESKWYLIEAYEYGISMVNKITQHHVGKELKKGLAWLESLPEVKKIFLGMSASARHAYTPGAIRYQMDVTGGVKVIGYTGNGVVNIVVTIDAAHKQEFLEKLASKWAV